MNTIRAFGVDLVQSVIRGRKVTTAILGRIVLLIYTFLALNYTKYADSEPDSFFIAQILYNCYNICGVKNSRSARGLRQGCFLIYLGAPLVTPHQRRLALP